jgi:hypothetical protein
MKNKKVPILKFLPFYFKNGNSEIIMLLFFFLKGMPAIPPINPNLYSMPMIFYLKIKKDQSSRDKVSHGNSLQTKTTTKTNP